MQACFISSGKWLTKGDAATSNCQQQPLGSMIAECDYRLLFFLLFLPDLAL